MTIGPDGHSPKTKWQTWEIAVYDYANVAFAALFGFAVFGQVPDAFSWFGIAVIVSMGVWMNRTAK